MAPHISGDDGNDVEERDHQRRTDSYQLQNQQSSWRTAQLPQNHGSGQPGAQDENNDGVRPSPGVAEKSTPVYSQQSIVRIGEILRTE